MLKVLLKKQFTEIFRAWFYDAKKNKARSKASTAFSIGLFLFLMIVVVGGMMAFLSFALCAAMAEAGVEWLYFSLIGLMSVLLGTFGSVFSTYSGLYLAKDNDLLLSMPIPVGYIMVSRLLGVYLMGLLYAAVCFLPGMLVYLIMMPFRLAALLGTVWLFFLVSLIVLFLSCLLGWVVAKLSMKLKNKSIMTVFLALLAIGLYYFFYFKAQSVIADLVANAAVYGEKIRGAAYPVYLFGRVGQGDALAVLIVSAVVFALCGGMWLLLSRTFLHIATAKGGVSRKAYRASAVHVRSLGATLLGKEFARFTGSPNYMLNCGIGILLMPIAGVVLIIKGRALAGLLAEALPGMPGIVAVLLCAVLCMLASTVTTAAPSVSLEGKNLWLLHSLPIPAYEALLAKLRVQWILTLVPMLPCLAGMVVALWDMPLCLALSLLFAVVFSVVFGLASLFFGLKFPNVTWTNEIVPIKQSGAVLLAVFTPWIFALLFGAGFFLVGRFFPAEGYLAAFILVFAGVGIALYSWMRRKGTEILSAL